MASILERKESLLQEADRLEKEQFKKQIALLQEYYQKDAVRNKRKEAFEKLPKTKEFFVFFGAYKGEGEVIA